MSEEEQALEGGVAAPAPEPAAEQPDSNLSMAEYASQLLERREPTEEPEEATEGDAEAADTAVAEEDPLAEAIAEEAPDEPEPPAEQTDLSVLSKYNVDLANLSQEDTEALAKELGSSAVKRYGALTAQKQELSEANLHLQQQLHQQLQQSQTAQPAPAETGDDAPFANVHDDQQLATEVENLNGLIEWAEEGLDNEVEYDDAGNEYVVKDGDKTYGKADLKRIRTNARRILRKDAPARKQWLAQRAQYDQDAINTFSFLGEPESEDYALFMQTKSSPLTKSLADNLPGSNFYVGLMVKGLRKVQEERAAAEAAAGNPKKVNRPKAPTANVEAAGMPKGPKGEVKGKKALAAAKAKFEASGDMAAYTTYLQLKRAAA